MSYTQTIAAIATPAGRGGIAIVRISGPLAKEAAQKICSISQLKPRLAHFCKFKDGDEIIDEGLALYFKAPNSYTGEDVVELQGHGGTIVPQRVLAAVLKYPGIRHAQAGEFTKTAFLNGKMDLTEAEAVEDLISSGSSSAAKAALASLDGAFSKEVNELCESITNFRVHLEACLDFPEEHEDFFDSGKALDDLQAIKDQALKSLTKATQGLKLNDGARIILVGSPNAGKSSLLNALAGAEKAIVTNIPGTTRDILSVNIELNGINITITDTAGIRENPGDEIERIGINRAIAELKKADLVLLMIDSSKEANEAKLSLEKIKEDFSDNRQIIIVQTKSDLPANKNTQELLKSELFSKYEHVKCSVKLENGLDDLKALLIDKLGIIPIEGVYTARKRHIDELNEAIKAIDRAFEQIQIGDLVLTARELAIGSEHLGTITGQITSDDLLGKIFSTFCIGK